MPETDRIARIRSLLEEHSLNMKAVSLAAGKGETFVRDMLKRGRDPSASNLDAVESAIERLLGRVPLTPVAPEVREADAAPAPFNKFTLAKDVEVMGTVAGSGISKGAFRITSDPVDIVLRPPGLENVKGLYALYVEGDSMSPKYEPGDLIYVNPHRPARPGDVVVVQDPLADGDDFEGYVKILVRKTADWLFTRQLNPDDELKFKVTPALRVHRVYTTAELFAS